MRWVTFEQRSVPQRHQQLQQTGVCISQRSVSDLLWRYDELLGLRLSDRQRLEEIVRGQQQIILAIDRMQPEVGHEVLYQFSKFQLQIKRSK